MPVGSDINDLVALLRRTPAILDAWLDGLPDAWLLADEGPRTFSPRAVLGHLILGERADWMPRVRLIRAVGDAQPFDPFDRFGFAEMLRTRTTRGLHPALGPVTLGQLLATWATHDLNHLAQVARVMARTQDTEVGPWKEHLGVLAWKR